MVIMIYQFRKLIFVICLVAAVGLAFYGAKVPEVLKGSGFEMDGTYQKTNQVLEEEFGQSSDAYIVVLENQAQVSEEEFGQFVQQTAEQIRKVDHVTEVITPLESPSQFKPNIAYILTYFNGEIEVAEVTQQLEKSFIKNKDFATSLTGGAVIEEEMNQISQADLAKAEMIGLPIALIILLLAFGGLVAGVIPLLSGMLSVASAMGICYFIGLEMDLSVFVLNVTPMIGLAVSIDFALLYIHRFREELKTKSVSEAIRISNKTAGRSIIFSGACVVLGMAGMFFIDMSIFHSIAVGGIVVVTVSVIMATIFLPAFLSILGQRVNYLRFFKAKSDEQKSTWHKLAAAVMKKPIWSAGITLVLLGIAIIPVSHIKLEIPDVKALPEASEVRIAYEKFQEHFIPEDLTNVPVVLELDKGQATDLESLQLAKSFINELEQDQLVERVDSVFSMSEIEQPEMLTMGLQQPEQQALLEPVVNHFLQSDKILINVMLKAPATSAEAQDWVRDKASAMSSQKDFTYLIGGPAKYNQEIFDEILEKAPYGAGFILLTTFIVLLIAFRSIAIPIKAILMNVISLAATFGIIVWIFQDGHFGVPAAPIALILPIFTFSIVFGLSMDYEVFLISRIQEYYLETGDNDYATLTGLVSTSKIITSAAAIIIAVTGAFAFTEIVPVKQIGVGVALAIFIDATIVRMILVPSLMKLMGKWNWWLPFSKMKHVQKEGVE